jgi:hypothetical protein
MKQILGAMELVLRAQQSILLQSTAGTYLGMCVLQCQLVIYWGKIQFQKRTSILNMYVILGTVHNFGIFFVTINFKKLDVSIQGTQASAQFGPSGTADLNQRTLESSAHTRRGLNFS